MKEPELIIDKEHMPDKTSNKKPYIYIHYCPVCSKKSMEFYLEFNKKTKLYKFIEINMDIGDLPWSQLRVDWFCIVVSKRRNMLFINEEIEYCNREDTEKDSEKFIALSDDQFKSIIMAKELFYEFFEKKHKELYPENRLKFIPSNIKDGYDDYASRPKFCSKKCAEKFIASVIKDLECEVMA